MGGDDERKGMGSMVFQVFADDKQVFDSGKVVCGDPAIKVDLDLEGVDVLRLIVTDAGDDIHCDHADWADARLEAVGE